MDQIAAPANETPEHCDIRMNKDIAAFSYIWIMSLFIYLAKKESKFIQYHSKQGIVLFLLTIPVSFIPWIGKYLIFLVVAGMLLGFMNAANGQYRDVPIAGPLSRGELSISDLMRLCISTLKTLFATFRRIIKEHLRRNSHVASIAELPVTQAFTPSKAALIVDKK